MGRDGMARISRSRKKTMNERMDKQTTGGAANLSSMAFVEYPKKFVPRFFSSHAFGNGKKDGEVISTLCERYVRVHHRSDQL